MTKREREAGGPADADGVRNRALDQLCRFGNVVGASLDAASLVADAVEPLLSLIGADGLLVMLADGTDRALVPAARRGLELPAHAKALPMSAIAALGTEAVAFAGRAALPEPLAERIGDPGGPIAVAPLWAHGRLRGAIVAVRHGEPFAPVAMKALTAAAREFALAVESARLLAELQQAYSALMDSQEELIRGERLAAMGQLAATMAHEIRNPLATIFSAISQIRKHSKADGVSATLLDIAEEEAARLNQMVGGLLDFARPRKPSFERRHPLEIAREAVRAASEGEGAPAGVTIAVDPASADPVVSLDPDLVQRALQRLLDNAIHAVEDGGAITVRVLHGGADPASAIIEVADDGCGISRDVLAKVQEPFFSTRPSGIGLGLPTAKRIAEDHGGSLQISSEPGRGTVVRLLINAKPATFFSPEAEEPTS